MTKKEIKQLTELYNMLDKFEASGRAAEIVEGLKDAIVGALEEESDASDVVDQLQELGIRVP